MSETVDQRIRQFILDNGETPDQMHISRDEYADLFLNYLLTPRHSEPGQPPSFAYRGIPVFCDQNPDPRLDPKVEA